MSDDNTALTKRPMLERLRLRAPAGALIDQPQRLGILPTWWFWREPENIKMFRVPNFLIVVGSIVGTFALIPSWVAMFVMGSTAQVLALGLFERYVRRRALERREVNQLALAEPATALGIDPSTPDPIPAHSETRSIVPPSDAGPRERDSNFDRG